MKGVPGGLAWGWAILEGEGLGVGCWVRGDGVRTGESYEGQWVGVVMEESQGVSMELVEGQGLEGTARKFVAPGIGVIETVGGSVDLKLGKVVSNGDTSTRG